MQQHGFICWADRFLKLVKVKRPLFRANFSCPCSKEEDVLGHNEYNIIVD